MTCLCASPLSYDCPQNRACFVVILGPWALPTPPAPDTQRTFAEELTACGPLPRGPAVGVDGLGRTRDCCPSPVPLPGELRGGAADPRSASGTRARTSGSKPEPRGGPPTTPVLTCPPRAAGLGSAPAVPPLVGCPAPGTYGVPGGLRLRVVTAPLPSAALHVLRRQQDGPGGHRW